MIFLQEPVDEWMNIKDKNGRSVISLFYEDQKRYAFSFQMMAYISRLQRLQEAFNKAQNEKYDFNQHLAFTCLSFSFGNESQSII